MIQHTSFLGIPLRTRTQRRGLVLGYYAFLLAFAAIPLYRHKFMGAILAAQTFTIGSMLGGLNLSGPVKPYSNYTPARDPDASPLQSLNLGPGKPWSQRPPLDEREVHERDHAHYLAYSILRLASPLLLLLYWALDKFNPAVLAGNTPTLLWLFFVFLLSLPQSVILWTEPPPTPEASLALVHP